MYSVREQISKNTKCSYSLEQVKTILKLIKPILERSKVEEVRTLIHLMIEEITIDRKTRSVDTISIKFNRQLTEYLCLHENITGIEKDLAYLIALLHDIGRFEQIKRFNSFDDRNVDHATLGVQVLFDEGMIRQFIEDDQYDEVIRKAIAYHSLYKVPKGLDSFLLKQVLLIRDSDKLDNFRVKNIESIQTLFSISDADFYSQRVSKNILKDIENHTLILKENRHNEVDMWVSYMAFVFDLNFKSSYLFIRENDYIHRNMERLHFTGDLKEDMLFVEKICQSYIEEKCM